MLRRAIGLALPAVVAVLLYLPALDLELMGDDYQWVQLAHRATRAPLLLLADLDSFYRPASTMTLAIDRLVWRHEPAGYHLANVLFHAAVGVLLGAAARRVGLARGAATAVALLWVTSPFASEPAIAVAIRFENLLLLSWLGLVLIWPREGESWTWRRLIGAAALTLMALLSKETWVVTVALVWVLERYHHRLDIRQAVRITGPVAMLAVVYIVTYFAVFPSSKGYFDYSVAPLAKVPHMLAAFLYLEPLRPLAFELSWKAVLALVITVALGIVAWRHRRGAAAVGTALLVLPILPTLLVPYLPSRYTAIPYAGFLLTAAVAVHAGRTLSLRPWRWLAGGVAVLAAAVLVAGVATVRADITDHARVSAGHTMLLAEARAVAPSLPLDRPILVVREERDNPLTEIARSPRGLPKLLYPRHDDPYGLVDSAALFDWVLGRDDVTFRRLDGEWAARADVRGAVLSHRRGEFVILAVAAPSLSAQANVLRQRGFRLRLIEAESLD